MARDEIPWPRHPPRSYVLRPPVPPAPAAAPGSAPSPPRPARYPSSRRTCGRLP
jgi:hypothetical protein